MNRIKLYWSTSLQNGRKNFGDWLSPLLVEAISGCQVVHARPNDCDLMALGSILAKAKNYFWNRKIDIWGTGLIGDIGVFRSPHRIHALRGRKTAAAISNQRIMILGDPGLLCPMLLPDNTGRRKKYSVGLIPHYVDQGDPVLEKLCNRYPSFTIIDVSQPPLQVIRHVAACEMVVSSSLHGLIIADAYGVPSLWMKLSNKVWGNDFKFHDYFSIYSQKEVMPFVPLETTTEKDIMNLAESVSRPGIEEIKKSLYRSFPFKR
ncbi:MAG: polysaccharide pyruvyl transferase family protein [Syntrophales bacterium]|jgi:hypothetical protein|nr:polysaccharide pyruvyl transferase family protein [Syntrophales bacterium]NLN59385.1 polysaccharide pyruvyl transferase family protein [Deltaproteobacteria bacterium]